MNYHIWEIIRGEKTCMFLWFYQQLNFYPQIVSGGVIYHFTMGNILLQTDGVFLLSQMFPTSNVFPHRIAGKFDGEFNLTV